ncbi:metabolite transport protein [Gluconobacter thailandicus F149-1 = NBRC 100600]|nr:metabolite transport protein [Gluconobacter thailandicus F149-1 = NBRC 100600]
MARGMTMTHSFSFSIAIYAAQIPGYFSAAAAVELIGRRTTIAVYLLGSVLAAGLLVISHSDGSVVGAAMLLSLFLNGAYAGLYAYTPELFPTTLRATGNGTASAIGRIGAIVSPVLVGVLMPIIGFAGVFALITAVLLVGSTTVLFFGPRTEGLALEALSSQAESH